jgi:hypothetical protein
VPLTHSYRRVNEFIGLTVGSSGSNVGNISLQGSGGGAVQAFIAATDGIAQQAIYTVPAGHTAYVIYVSAGLTRTNVNDTCEVRISVRDGSVPGPWIVALNLSLAAQGGTFQSALAPPVSLPEKTDLKMSVIQITGSNLVVGCAIQLILVRNDLDY